MAISELELTEGAGGGVTLVTFVMGLRGGWRCSGVEGVGNDSNRRQPNIWMRGEEEITVAVNVNKHR